uniref:C2H2-type domain-containing protein n=1 Tax=Acrobeloides nanus TaxID=290746 RepID=A0A914CWE4_9BILA
MVENELGNGDTALDLSVKKPKIEEGNALAKLSSLVTTVGTKPANFLNFSKPEPSSEDNDPSKVFTCLQCFERFQTMDQLVKHMEKTLHFNQFKQANGKSDSNRDMKINNRYSMFSYKCVICGYSSNSSIDEHMTTFHSFKNPMEWIHAVKLVPL